MRSDNDNDLPARVSAVERYPSDEVQQWSTVTSMRDTLGLRLTYVANHLASRQYLLGEHFTVGDAYLYTVLTWTRIAGIDLAAYR